MFRPTKDQSILRQYIRSWRTGQRHPVDVPRSHRYGMLVGRIASPHGLDESGRRLATANHVLLPLLLLHLQSKSAAEDALGKKKV